MDTDNKPNNSGQTGTATKLPEFTPQQLHDALFGALDLMERAICPFVLLKETAYKCRESSSSIDFDLVGLKQIDLGIKVNQLTKEVLSTFETYAKEYRNDGTDISFICNGVPVVVRIIHRNYQVFNNPDTIFYKVEEFKIPNPFDKYWEMRGFIR
jgi:hypothetical protein